MFAAGNSAADAEALEPVASVNDMFNETIMTYLINKYMKCPTNKLTTKCIRACVNEPMNTESNLSLENNYV